jgi:hypothetical protein
VRSASSAALNVSAAAIGAPVCLMRTAASLTDPVGLVRSASSYVPEARSLVAAALGWAAWPPTRVSLRTA